MTSWHTDFLVGDWLVSPKLNRISKDGESASVKHKSMAVLVFLADGNGEVITRDEVMDGVWPGMEVTDDVLTQSIVELRKALGDEAKNPRIIETIPRVGFRLIASIRPAKDDSSLAPLGPIAGRPNRRHLLAAFAVIILGAVLWTFVGRHSGERSPVITVRDSPSIAVMPFVNTSDDPENEFFAEGMSDEIRNLLGRIPDLKVIGRTSSHAFKGQNQDLRVVGQQLGVSHVLEGSVRKSGDRVRITMQLIDTSDGAQIWSDSYDRVMTDIFEVQDDVAADVIDALQIHVGTLPTRGRPTESPEAYTMFLRAKAAVNLSEFQEAEERLLSVIELDPNFAEAYEMLAYTYWNLAGLAIDAVTAQQLVSEAAAKAIAIDPDIVLAQALYQAAVFGPSIRYRKLEAFEKAAREQPDNPWVLETLVFSLTENGYLEKALRLAERYVEVDPLSLMANYYWFASLYAVGRTKDAIAVADFLNRSDMSPGIVTWTIGGINLLEERDEIAITQFEASMRQQDSDLAWVRELVAGARDSVSGQAYLDRRIPRIGASMSEVELTSLYLFFGFLDRHFELVLATEPSDSTWHVAGIHLWRGNVFRRTGFTAHPKYLDLVKSLGVVDTWERRGPPDFCEKVDGQWVCE